MSDQFLTQTGNFVARGAEHVNPALVDILGEAANRLGVKVEAYSGYRPGDPRFHGKGMATDIRIIGPDGKPVPNYQSAEGFSQYEKLAQEARKIQQEKYPSLDKNFRWGGYFSGGKGKYGAMDLMHFDLGGSDKLGMAGGSWEKGLSDRQAALFGMDNYKAKGLESLADPPQNRSVASTFDPTAWGAVSLDAPAAPSVAAAAPSPAPDATQAAFAGDAHVAPAVGALNNLVQPVAAQQPGFQPTPISAPIPFEPPQAAEPPPIAAGDGNGPGPTGDFPGLVTPGNIDLSKRPIVKNADGTISTVRSMSFADREGGPEILIPTVSPDGKILSNGEAIDLYHKTGQHLGIFDNPDNATRYAESLHESQAKFYGGGQGAKPAFDPVAAGAVPLDPTQFGAVPVDESAPAITMSGRQSTNVEQLNPDGSTSPTNIPKQPGQPFGSIEGTTPSVMDRLYIAGKALGLPVDQMTRDNASIDAGMRGVADTASFGLADEIAAKLGSATGVGGREGNYEGNLNLQRTLDRVDEQQHPVARGAGQLAGGVAVGMLAPAAKAANVVEGAVARAPNALARIGQGAKLGATYGGLYGFGSGEGFEDRAKNTLSGALTGGTVGAAIPAGTAVAGKVYNTLADVMMRPAANAIRSVVAPEANALRLAQRALARDSLTPDQAGAKMSDALAAGDDTTMLIDVGGENTRRLGRAATNIPGEGADKIKTAVYDRQLAQPERVAEAVRKGLDDPATYFSTIDDIIAQRQTAAKPLYDQAYKTPVPFTAKLESLLGRGKVMKDALRRARDMGEAEGIPSQQFFAKIADDGSYTIQSVPDARQWDLMKRSLDDIVQSETETMPNGSEKLSNLGRIVSGIRREMLTEVDQANPAYAKARQVYSTASESLDAVTKGGKLLDADPELARRTLADMSAGDKQLARLGISKALVDRVQRARDGANVVRGIFASPRNRAVLKEAFPTEASFKDFQAAMEREGQKTRTNMAIGGNSTTAAQAADLASNFDAGVAGHIISGRPLAAAGALVQKALARATVVNEATARELAKILTTTDPAVGRQIMTQMQHMAMRDARVAKNLLRVRTLLRNSAIVGGTRAGTDVLHPPVVQPPMKSPISLAAPSSDGGL
ncbi:hypothetical protein [Mesorhizobium sp. L103C131B0]|uniref:hypothetical protein n=1 Tax=Mesorhizobium sp. L103C131B0 TaxID=1287089 RepID=UPI0003CFC2B2|nr:hypothetical protein [Mesorhizobium sp. L103C131B0]ESZ56643.1 hypothetical protein X729_24255 [Mesorhizobium sp. L103C131B0]